MAWPLSLSPDAHDSAHEEHAFSGQRHPNAWKRASMPPGVSTPVEGRNSGLAEVPTKGRERSRNESPIFAELRTNLIIRDEKTIITQLTYLLAAQFARRDLAVMVELNHGVCVAMGGSFEPCYRIVISALLPDSNAQQNARNGAFIQSFLANILGVPQSRGMVQFQRLEACDLATNGTTLQQELDNSIKKHKQDLNDAHEPSPVMTPHVLSAVAPRLPTANGLPPATRNEQGNKDDARLSIASDPASIEDVGLAAPLGRSAQKNLGSNNLARESIQPSANSNDHHVVASKQKKSLLRKHVSASTTNLPSTVLEDQDQRTQDDHREGNVLYRMKTNFTNRSAISVASLRHEDDAEARVPEAPPVPDETPTHTKTRERRMSRRRSFVEAFRAAAAAT